MVSFHGLRGSVLALLSAILGIASAFAATENTTETPVPAWMEVDKASLHADQVDPMHAVIASVVRQRQLSPLRAARLFAVVRVAQAEAVLRLEGADPVAVAALAAAEALSWMLPLEDPARWMVPALFIANGSGSVSELVAARVHAAVWPVLSRAIDDGADARRRPLRKPDPIPGTWLRTPPLFAEQPAEPQGAEWKPWCAGSETLQVPPPVEHGSAQWNEELRHVLEVRIRLDDRQASIARRWHLDAGSVTPPGVWNGIAVSFLSETRASRQLQARVMAVLNAAMQDALVAAWRVKLQYWSERPITAVRRELDADFEPLLVTPPFPGYVSGHAAVSAAAAGVLSHYFPDQRRQWNTLAREAATSRLLGGIHFASDNEQGLALGLQVAQRCIAAFEGEGPSNWAKVVISPEETSAGFFVRPRIAVMP